MLDLAHLRSLLGRIDAGEDDLNVEDALANLAGVAWNAPSCPSYLSDTAAARSFVSALLPGFWVSSGICHISGHASLGPDYNRPGRDELLREWPYRALPTGQEVDVEFNADLGPQGGGDGREARAIMHAALQALIYKAEASHA